MPLLYSKHAKSQYFLQKYPVWQHFCGVKPPKKCAIMEPLAGRAAQKQGRPAAAGARLALAARPARGDAL